jgi:hypothetical protein
MHFWRICSLRASKTHIQFKTPNGQTRLRILENAGSFARVAFQGGTERMNFSWQLIQINTRMSPRRTLRIRTWISEVGMPSSTIRKFTDPDVYFAGIRNLQIEGLVTKRGDFRAESTRIDLHRLWMHRFDESLPRIMRVTPSGARALLLFATHPDQPPTLANGIETSQDRMAMFGLGWPYYLRSSAAAGWGTLSLTPEDLATAGKTIIGRELTPPTFMRPTRPSNSSSPAGCFPQVRSRRLVAA